MSIIVTGSARGIGRAIALRLASDAKRAGSAGARFVLADRLAPELEATAKDMRQAGADVATLCGDLAAPEFCRQTVDVARERFGRIDTLVCNAATVLHGLLKDLSVEDWDETIAVNVRAAWLLGKAAYPMLKASKGQIIVISSVSGLNPQPRIGAYSASKAALNMLAAQLAIEWGPDGIRTNIVTPGMVHTPASARSYADAASREKRLSLVPIHRIGEPEDIAAAVSFLAGPDATYCNGANIVVDGGLTPSLMTHQSYVPKPTTNAREDERGLTP